MKLKLLLLIIGIAFICGTNSVFAQGSGTSTFRGCFEQHRCTMAPPSAVCDLNHPEYCCDGINVDGKYYGVDVVSVPHENLRQIRENPNINYYVEVTGEQQKAVSMMRPLDINATNLTILGKCNSSVPVEVKPVIIVVDNITFSSLSEELNQYAEDANGTILINNFTNPSDLRNYLRGLWQNYEIEGAVLVGDVPSYCFSTSMDPLTTEPFPSDYLFMDLTSSVGFDDMGCVNKIEKPEVRGIFKKDIWVGRIKPPDSNNSIILLKNYFDRNHKYRTGNISYSKGVLYYPYNHIVDFNWTQDTCFNNSRQEISENTVYDLDNTTIICSADSEGRNSYLNELSKNREWVVTNVHGDSFVQYFNPPFSFVEVRNAQPKALFYSFLSCANGFFTKENYIAGWYLFSGDGLVVYAYTVPTMLGGEEWAFTSLPLSAGINFGEAMKYDSSYVLTILGDPTLKIKGEKVPNITIDKTDVDFGFVGVGETKEISINITNSGSENFIISKYDYSKVIEVPENPNRMTSTIIYSLPEKISPNGQGQLKFIFEPDVNGSYLSEYIFPTNDPKYSFLKIDVHGQGGTENTGAKVTEIETSSGIRGITIENVENKSFIKSENVSAITTKKLTVEESKLYVETSVGNKQVKILPDTASEKAIESGIQAVKEIEIKEESAVPVYSVTGTRQAKILFIIPVNMNMEIKIDAETGNVISINKPWWSFLAY